MNGWLLLTSVVAKEFNPSLTELGSGPSVRLNNQEFNPSLAELGSGPSVRLNNPQTSPDPQTSPGNPQTSPVLYFTLLYTTLLWMDGYC